MSDWDILLSLTCDENEEIRVDTLALPLVTPPRRGHEGKPQVYQWSKPDHGVVLSLDAFSETARLYFLVRLVQEGGRHHVMSFTLPAGRLCYSGASTNPIRYRKSIHRRHSIYGTKERLPDLYEGIKLENRDFQATLELTYVALKYHAESHDGLKVGTLYVTAALLVLGNPNATLSPIFNHQHQHRINATIGSQFLGRAQHVETLGNDRRTMTWEPALPPPPEVGVGGQELLDEVSPMSCHVRHGKRKTISLIGPVKLSVADNTAYSNPVRRLPYVFKKEEEEIILTFHNVRLDGLFCVQLKLQFRDFTSCHAAKSRLQSVTSPRKSPRDLFLKKKKKAAPESPRSMIVEMRRPVREHLECLLYFSKDSDTQITISSLKLVAEHNYNTVLLF